MRCHKSIHAENVFDIFYQHLWSQLQWTGTHPHFPFHEMVCQGVSRIFREMAIWQGLRCCRDVARDVPEICPRYAQDMPEVCPRYARDMPEKYAKKVGAKCPLFLQNLGQNVLGQNVSGAKCPWGKMSPSRARSVASKLRPQQADKFVCGWTRKLVKNWIFYSLGLNSDRDVVMGPMGEM